MARERIYGIDISHYQPGFDFGIAKAAGVKFAILKAGGADGDIEVISDVSIAN